jgi:hypothetical protein
VPTRLKLAALAVSILAVGIVGTLVGGARLLQAEANPKGIPISHPRREPLIGRRRVEAADIVLTTRRLHLLLTSGLRMTPARRLADA